MSEIIPYILVESMIDEMSDDQLQLLVNCTTQRSMHFITDYLSKTDDSVDPVIQKKIATAYSYVINRDKFLNSDKTKECCELLKDLNYNSVSVADSKEYLESVCEAIKYITSSDYAVPYIAPVDGNALKELKESLSISIASDSSLYWLKLLLENLNSYGDVFRDPRSEYNKGTVVKKVVKNAEMYEILERGVEFIIGLKEAGKLSNTWRFL